MTKPNNVFTQRIADLICDCIAEGQSLTSICDEEGMPTAGAVGWWRKNNPKFDAQYLAARELQAEKFFEEMLDIIDDNRNDWIEKQTAHGSYIALNKEAIARSRARVDVRFRMMESMSNRYSKKLQVDHKSSDGTMSPKDMTDDQKAAKIAAIMARAKAKHDQATSGVDDGSDMV